jgi:hypothetical protein
MKLTGEPGPERVVTYPAHPPGQDEPYELAQCPSCNGRGGQWVWGSAFLAEDVGKVMARSKVGWWWENCTTCVGTGSVKFKEGSNNP